MFYRWLAILPSESQRTEFVNPQNEFFFEIFHRDGQNGDSGRTRTPNLLIRSQLLYPVELRNHFINAKGSAGFYPICPDAFCQ